MSDTTNQTTADLATDRDRLPLHSLQLIGVITGPDTARALLRQADGTTLVAAANDDTPAGRLTAVGADFALVQRGNRLHRLVLAA